MARVVPLLAFPLAVTLSGARSAVAQQSSSTQQAGVQAPEVATKNSPPLASCTSFRTEAKQPNHRFWDRENSGLFAGVAASRTLDYFSTLNMRKRGRQEILLSNDVVDNHAAFAVVEAAGTGVSIGAAYLFHRYHHHALERWTSLVHIGLATTGAVRNYCLKTAHPAVVSLHP